MPPRGKNPTIIRIVEGVRGTVSLEMELIIRFDYGHIRAMGPQYSTEDFRLSPGLMP